ncbi:MAG: GYD domain-containing protein [Candidatus Heimdallarchaeota archaeon]|nr:MAG: GYD domain-containing protein [Candidatus Heimdallarchaeota archaeon]
MPLYILATRFDFEQNDLAKRKEQGKKWLELVKAKVPDVKWIAHYAILGPYDFLDIFEAENETQAAKVSLLSRAHGATQAESWTAIKYADFLSLIEDLQ